MCIDMYSYLTVSILEDDAHHVSLSTGVLIHQPERLHLGVHEPALLCTALTNTLIVKHMVVITVSGSYTEDELHLKVEKMPVFTKYCYIFVF